MRQMFDSSRRYGVTKVNRYTPFMPSAVKHLFRHELEEAKKSVSINSRRQYKYEPSEAYKKELARQHKMLVGSHEACLKRAALENAS